MKGHDLLKANNLQLTEALADIMVKAIEKWDPDYYEGVTFEKWSNYKIAHDVMSLDLDEKDVVEIISTTCRFAKLWIFS